MQIHTPERLLYIVRTYVHAYIHKVCITQQHFSDLKKLLLSCRKTQINLEPDGGTLRAGKRQFSGEADAAAATKRSLDEAYLP